MAQVALLSEAHFELCSGSGMLQKLVGDLKSPDILAVLNIVELFTSVFSHSSLTRQMVIQPFGFQFLERADVIKDLYALLCRDASDEITEYLTLCAVVKFWAALVLFQVRRFDTLTCHKAQEITRLQESFDLLQALQRHLQSDKPELKSHTLTCLGNLGSHPQGAQLLISQGTLLDTFAQVYKEAHGDMFLSCVQTLSCLLTRDEIEPLDSPNCRLIYNQFPNLTLDILQFGKHSFEAYRVAAYALVKGIACHVWGLDVIRSESRLLGLILDRSFESTLTGKEWKFTLVQRMLAHPSCRDHLGDFWTEKLLVYIQEGPFYSAQAPIVAMEST